MGCDSNYDIRSDEELERERQRDRERRRLTAAGYKIAHTVRRPVLDDDHVYAHSDCGTLISNADTHERVCPNQTNPRLLPPEWSAAKSSPWIDAFESATVHQLEEPIRAYQVFVQLGEVLCHLDQPECWRLGNGFRQAECRVQWAENVPHAHCSCGFRTYYDAADALAAADFPGAVVGIVQVRGRAIVGRRTLRAAETQLIGTVIASAAAELQLGSATELPGLAKTSTCSIGSKK